MSRALDVTVDTLPSTLVEEPDMSHTFVVGLFAFGLFLGMLLFLEIGRRAGLRRVKEDSGTAGGGVGAVDGAVFALLGLLLAFTFSGASSRFDTRRQLIVDRPTI